nr:SDR family NAD(P)-dependent oxidoreductase [Actinomycetota bacterium]
MSATEGPGGRRGRVSGKVCVVTGAGSGIGRAVAIRLAEEGGAVLCADVNADGVADTVRQIRAAGGDAVDRIVDVADPAAVDAMIGAAVERWGGVDVLVNNAGVNIPGVLHEVPNEVIDRTLDVNVKGQIYGCRAVIPVMLARGAGSIVNVASVNGIVSEPFL